MNRVDVLAGGALVGFVSWSYAAFFEPAVFVDDAMIYVRVVGNIVDGQGWTYNSGEAVNPCTSPLFTIVLVSFTVLGELIGPWLPGVVPSLLEVERVPALVNLLGMQAIVLIQYTAFRRESPLLGVAVALVTAGGAILRRSAGMETSLFVALFLGAILAYTRERRMTAAILAGLTCVARPEGAALVVLLAGADVLARRRLDMRLPLLAAAVVVPWLIFSWLTFGGVVPHSVLVKSTAHIPIPPGYFLKIFFLQPLHPWIALGLTAVGAVRLICARRPVDRYVVLVITFATIQTAAYGIGNAHPGYFWYFAPGNLAVDMVIALGLFWLATVAGRRAGARLGAHFPEGSRLATATPHVALAAVALLVVVAMPRIGITGSWVIGPYRLALTYIEVGRWIDEHTEPSARVAAPEIGYLGFYSRREIIDPYSLVNPEALSQLRAGIRHWWYLDRPEIIVSLSKNAPRGSRPALLPPSLLEEFTETYEAVYRANGVHVWRLASDAVAPHS